MAWVDGECTMSLESLYQEECRHFVGSVCGECLPVQTMGRRVWLYNHTLLRAPPTSCFCSLR